MPNFTHPSNSELAVFDEWCEGPLYGDPFMGACIETPEWNRTPAPYKPFNDFDVLEMNEDEAVAELYWELATPEEPWVLESNGMPKTLTKKQPSRKRKFNQ